MGLCKTSNFSIFTFITVIDLKIRTRSYSSCLYRMMQFLKCLNGKVSKMMTSHFGTLSASSRSMSVRKLNTGFYQLEIDKGILTIVEKRITADS